MKYLLCFFLLAAVAGCGSPFPDIEDRRLNVYPNPASDIVIIYVMNPDAHPFILKGYDNRGKEILNVNGPEPDNRFYNYRIDLPESGTYRFTLDMDNVKGIKTIACIK